MDSFEYKSSPSRIIFGNGAIDRVGEAMDGLGCNRALILATPFQKEQADALASSLGAKSAGVHAEAVMHTPMDVTDKALLVMKDLSADCTVALGGGSTTGLGRPLPIAPTSLRSWFRRPMPDLR